VVGIWLLARVAPEASKWESQQQAAAE
jgi:hypothetical protein